MPKRYSKLTLLYAKKLKEAWDELDPNYIIRAKMSAEARDYGASVSETFRDLGIDSVLRRLARRHRLGERLSKVIS